jgi:hypothetical protein
MIRFIVTVIFGLLWWWVYNRVGAGLAYLVILGSVLAVCACCCQGGRGEGGGVWKPGDFNFDSFFACLRRCWPNTVILMVALYVIGVIAVWVTTGMAPSTAELVNIFIAAVGAPWLVRIICCAYEA